MHGLRLSKVTGVAGWSARPGFHSHDFPSTPSDVPVGCPLAVIASFSAHPGGTRHARRAVGRRVYEVAAPPGDDSDRRSRPRPTRRGEARPTRAVSYRGGRSETDVPAEQQEAEAQARIPSADAYQVRECGDQPPSGEGPSERVRVSVATGTGPEYGLGVEQMERRGGRRFAVEGRSWPWPGWAVCVVPWLVTPVQSGCRRRMVTLDVVVGPDIPLAAASQPDSRRAGG